MFNRSKKGLKSFLLLSLFLTFLVVPSFAMAEEQEAVTFNDVNRTHPYYTAITYLSQKAVVSGYEDHTYRSANLINKAEALKIILKGSNLVPDEPFGPYFPDVTEDQWFSPFVMKAKALGFVSGNATDGTFTPEKPVNLAEFLKMLLAANNIDISQYGTTQILPNVPLDAWYAPHLNYAVTLGIVQLSPDGTLDAGKSLTRGEVASMMYLLSLILQGSDTPFLLSRAEAEMAQIEVYIAANMVNDAKTASALAVDLTQQAYKNMPTDAVVLGAAKIARAYDWLVSSFILGIEGQNDAAAQKANDAIHKATEAWEANNATQPIAKHIKDRAREILTQVGGIEE